MLVKDLTSKLLEAIHSLTPTPEEDIILITEPMNLEVLFKKHHMNLDTLTL